MIRGMYKLAIPTEHQQKGELISWPSRTFRNTLAGMYEARDWSLKNLGRMAFIEATFIVYIEGVKFFKRGK